MTKNRFCILGMAAVLLSFGLALAACGGGSGGEATAKGAAKAPPTPEELYGAKAPDPDKLKGETLTIPPGLTVIPEGYLDKFYKGKKFDNIIIPEGVTKIEEYAFNGPLIGQGPITTVVFPSTLKEIGRRAFNSQSIKELYLPDSVTTIGDGAFRVNKITKLTLPKNLKVIPGSCFAKNELKGVVLPAGLTTINDYAFYQNKDLKAVVWPEGPVAFPPGEYRDSAKSVFEECAFTEATFPKGMTMIPRKMYAQNQIRNLVVPEGIELVGIDAFYNCPMESITLPASLKMIAIGSFAPKDLKKAPIKTITVGGGLITDGEANNKAAMAGLGLALAGPVALIALAVGPDGKTHLPYDFMSFYEMYERKAGAYTYKEGSGWAVKN
jgi:hypothetical protein